MKPPQWAKRLPPNPDPGLPFLLRGQKSGRREGPGYHCTLAPSAVQQELNPLPWLSATQG